MMIARIYKYIFPIAFYLINLQKTERALRVDVVISMVRMRELVKHASRSRRKRIKYLLITSADATSAIRIYAMMA